MLEGATALLWLKSIESNNWVIIEFNKLNCYDNHKQAYA